MIQIGKYRFGIAPFSMVIVFIVLSVCAVTTAFHQTRPEWSMPLVDAILINEGMAVFATLVYGIIVHLAIEIIDRIHKRKRS